MSKAILKAVVVMCAVSFLTGCVSTRRYVEVKDRVDQEIKGNGGYLLGTPQPQDRSGLKKTRKVYVLEIETKDKKKAEEAAPAPAPLTVPGVSTSSVAQPSSPNFAAMIESAPAVSSAPQEYTVQSGDTLQKISKKFYDSYRKWNKIYEANKDKIRDPNRLKAGVVLTIP